MKGIKAKLTKISNNKNALRTDSIEGMFIDLPKIDSSFTIFGEPLNPIADARMIYTSYVKEIKMESDKVITLITENSEYQLELRDHCFIEDGFIDVIPNVPK